MPDYSELSKRERQIMEIIHRLSEASVQEVVDNLADQPSYNTIRVSIYNLKNKGYLQQREEGKKYIYQPAVAAEQAEQSALKHVVRTYFGGSTPKVVSTLLNLDSSKISEAELDELAQLIEVARQKKGKQ
ncbi:MAG: BlaI/MecI/CopY family transcriptional regulator [Saprospiraceae bacterium]|nr:BlaI/MecI/CopY family transcriptional regulator [Saprospiraceae bacterium]